VGWHGRRFVFGGGKADNPIGLSDQIFNLWQAASAENLVIVEGPFDALAVQRGLRIMDVAVAGVIALLGTNLSNNQAATLAHLNPRRVWLMLDGDAAGIKGTMNAAKRLFAAGISEVYNATSPGDPDPDERWEHICGILNSANPMSRNIRMYRPIYHADRPSIYRKEGQGF
jgi:hypothetical protein